MSGPYDGQTTPTHKEIMTKWWRLGSGTWCKVRRYYEELPTKKQYQLEYGVVDKSWFAGRDSADIPPDNTITSPEPTGEFVRVEDVENMVRSDNLYDEIINDISVLWDKVDELPRHTLESERNRDWISVKDRLPDSPPEQRVRYLCYNKNYTGKYGFVVAWREYASGPAFEPDFGEVTHWTPLPDPPEPEIERGVE